MASRKLNFLLYAFTRKTETLRNGSSGIGSVSNRLVLYGVCA